MSTKFTSPTAGDCFPCRDACQVTLHGLGAPVARSRVFLLVDKPKSGPRRGRLRL
jgi:hypothetical protein